MAKRGVLRVLLGAAPGVGKTYAMLSEGRRRKARGTDVVVAVVETHGRSHTAAQLEGLEVVPRKALVYRGTTFSEMDVEAVLRRRPDVALVDELAHTNVPGSKHARRADDVEELLAHGIDVITTVNVQHLESLNDVVEQITGVKQRETVPDATVRAADQIELIDMDPDALRRRMMHGNVYAPDKVEAALKNYFRPGNLTALRELALLWVADRVDAGLSHYRHQQAITNTWQTRDRVVVALSGGKEGALLLRRGARLVHKGVGGELIAVFVARQDGLRRNDQRALDEQRRLVEDLDGTFVALTGDDPAAALVEYARKINATSIVVGSTRASKLQRFLADPMDRRIINAAGDIDVHVVPHEWTATGSHRRAGNLSVQRRVVGAVLAVLLPLAATAMVTYFHWINEALSTMVFLAATVAVSLVGGLWPALISAGLGAVLLNWFFTEPVHTLTIADPQSVISLVILLFMGVAVASVVDRAAARARFAAESRSEADTLFLLTSQVLAAQFSTSDTLELVRETFRIDGVALRRRDSVTSPWQVEAAAGTCAGQATSVVKITDFTQLACWGNPLRVSDERVLQAFSHQFVARLERDRLRQRTRQMAELEARDTLQTALLAAVSHDLRTPLAAIKAAASSLVDDDVALAEPDRRELLVMVNENTSRLERLISNLLDMTRLRTGHLRPIPDSVSAETLVAEVMRDHPGVEAQFQPGLPLVTTDRGLVNRVLGNLVDNAVRHQPPSQPVRIEVTRVTEGISVKVIDAGPGISPERRKAMFEPFQQVGDHGPGIGLGLAVAEGFAHAVGATLVPRDTPGGGLTMELIIPVTWQGGEAA